RAVEVGRARDDELIELAGRGAADLDVERAGRRLRVVADDGHDARRGAGTHRPRVRRVALHGPRTGKRPALDVDDARRVEDAVHGRGAARLRVFVRCGCKGGSRGNGQAARVAERAGRREVAAILDGETAAVGREVDEVGEIRTAAIEDNVRVVGGQRDAAVERERRVGEDFPGTAGERARAGVDLGDLTQAQSSGPRLHRAQVVEGNDAVDGGGAVARRLLERAVVVEGRGPARAKDGLVALSVKRAVVVEDRAVFEADVLVRGGPGRQPRIVEPTAIQNEGA